MASLAFFAYAIGHCALFFWALLLFLRRRTPGTVPLLLVTAGLVYGNAMLGLGRYVGHGPVLEDLSVPRFFLHAIVTPMLMLSALGLVRRAGVAWARTAAVTIAVTALVLAMIALGFHTDMIRLQLEAKDAAGVVSFTNAAASGPPLPALVVVAVLIAAGLLVWRRTRWPWLLAGALAQLVLASLGDAIVVAGNLGELALLTALVAADWRLAGPEASDAKLSRTPSPDREPSFTP